MNIKHYFSKQHVLSITMIAVCAIYLVCYPYYDNPDTWDYINLVGTSIALLTAVIVTLRIDVNIQFSAGLIGVGLGAMIICKLIGGLTSTELAQIACGAIGCTMGFLCLVFSFPIYCGSKYDTRRISITLLIYCALLIVMILWDTAFKGVDLFAVLDTFKLELLTIVPALMYIWSLSNTEISYRSLNIRARDNLDSIAEATFSDRDAYILRESLMDARDRWYTVESGYIQKAKCIPIHLGRRWAKMIVEKWYDGTYWCMIVNDDTGTLMQTYRFEIIKIVPNDKEDVCDYIKIYGTDGFFIKIMVKENSVAAHLTISERISRFMLGY